ncbi:MAG: YjjW family glycine radical enzyme activase [Erysipelotrichaceae bacterium]
MQATINNIIPFSNVDGEGNRTAIFFQSCPFDCWYCHNPETIQACKHCGGCVPICEAKALSIVKDEVVWNKSLCVGCGSCETHCPHSSTPKTKVVTPEQLIAIIEPYFPFICGVTVSGGECMEHAEFLLKFAKLLVPYNKTLLLDSNGYYDFSKHSELLKYSSGVMLDVKAYDDDFHRLLTSKSNETTLNNLKYLKAVNKLVEVRTVVLPHALDQSWNTIEATLSLLGPEIPYKLLAYRPYGVREQYLEKLGNQALDLQELEKMRKKCEDLGFQNIVLV